MKPWVKGSLDSERVWLAPSWNADKNVPEVDRANLQRQLTRLGNRCGVTFFVTFTREEDSGMDGAAVAGDQVEEYRGQRGFPTYTYVVLAVIRSKRPNPQTRRYTYSAGLRVGRSLKFAGFDDADQARVLREAGHWVMWDNPKPNPQEFAREVAVNVVDELSFSFVNRRRCS